MKSVLISIRPQWCEKIANREKTIEVRKSRPKIETPFKCYIYCTFPKKPVYTLWLNRGTENKFLANGKVIGEFVCDRIFCSQAYFDSQGKNHLTNVFPKDIKKTCLTEYELWDYIAGKAVKANQLYDGYLWRISDLKIYDKPKELSEFRPICKFDGKDAICALFCPNWKYDGGLFFECTRKVTRPPQSYMYVKEL